MSASSYHRVDISSPVLCFPVAELSWAILGNAALLIYTCGWQLVTGDGRYKVGGRNERKYVLEQSCFSDSISFSSGQQTFGDSTHLVMLVESRASRTGTQLGRDWQYPNLARLGMSYLLYGMMLLISSILAHYSAAHSHQASLSTRIALAFSHCLRRIGKLLAIANTIWVILTCILQYSGFYDTCFCNSSMIGRGKAAYGTIVETTAQAALAKAAWIGALVLACTSASAFVALVGLLLDTLPA